MLDAIELDAVGEAPAYFKAAAKSAQPGIRGKMYITLPSGETVCLSNGTPGRVSHMVIHNPDMFRVLMRDGWVSFGETYMSGWWSTDDLQGFLDHAYDIEMDVYDTSLSGSAFVRLYEKFRHWLNSNTRSQAKKNISYHYDLGNTFYGLWLDDTMTYSSARFETGQESLENAQNAKYDSMVAEMGAKPGDHILEIGCGWGGFAERAATAHGLKVTGLTISQEQFDYAQERIAKAGLSDQVEIKLCDYRDEKGTYDGIASIEMFEAVGEKYWPTYFDAVRDRLKPGKSATLQIITVEDARFEAYRKGVDFIQKYIFPGGMLPSPKVLRAEVEKAGLNVAKSIEFGQCYSQTLRRWHETFNARWDDIQALGFDDRFRRMWNFYLTSCAAGFMSGNCDVTQITVAKPA